MLALICFQMLRFQVKASLGGKVEMIVAGAAKCNEDALRFFMGLKIPIMEAYASTEGLMTSLNTFDGVCVGTTGTVANPRFHPSHGMEDKALQVKLAGEDNEILMKGETVFKG